MPIDQTNLQANPVTLEENVFVTVHKSEGEYVAFYNSGSTTYQNGEPFVAGGVVWIAQDRILPGTTGPRCCNFLVDVMVDPDLASAINQDALVYIDTDITDAANPIGYATSVEPTNGFVLGRAVVADGASSVVAATTDDARCLVRSAPADFAEFSE